MNTYDFDKTIYINDSSADFYKWCFLRRPGAIIPTLPRTLIKALLYAAKRIETKELKEQVFSFLCNLEHVSRVLEIALAYRVVHLCKKEVVVGVDYVDGKCRLPHTRSSSN